MLSMKNGASVSSESIPDFGRLHSSENQNSDASWRLAVPSDRTEYIIGYVSGMFAYADTRVSVRANIFLSFVSQTAGSVCERGRTVQGCLTGCLWCTSQVFLLSALENHQ